MIASILVLAAAVANAISEAPLQPWATLVGHCWARPAPGNPGMDKHCFESVYGGQHIRDRHVVTIDGREVYAGEALYSAKGPQVVCSLAGIHSAVSAPERRSSPVMIGASMAPSMRPRRAPSSR